MPGRLAGSAVCRTIVIVALPVVLLWPWRGIGLAADDIFCVRTAFSLSPVRLLRGDEWTHPPLAGTRAWRPLTVASFGATHAIAGPSPTVYRLTNVVLHGVVSAAVAALAHLLTGSVAAGWVAGVLFAVHPAHHENVLWIAGRTHLLSALFTLVALWLALAAGDRPAGRRTAAGAGIAGASLAAVASYEPAVMAPAVILAVTALVSKETAARRVAGGLRLAAPALAAVMAGLGFRWLVVAPPGGDALAYLSPRVAKNVAGLIGRGLAVPRDAAGPLLTAPVFLVSAACVAVLLWMAWTGDRGRRVALAGCALMGVSFVPFAALSGYADRFIYLPTAGLVLALAAGVSAAVARRQRGPSVAATAVVIALATAWTGSLVAAARQWDAAGRITGSLTAALRDDPWADTAERLLFFCVPDVHGAALVYVTYFETDVNHALGDGPRIVVRRRDGDAVTAAVLTSQLEAGDVAYRWNQPSWRLERLTGAGAVVLPRDEPLCPPVPDVIRP